ncbi:MAG: 7-cyano-7-deazaguanine synthase [Candidatus Krumholzibacteriia bacterium]
MTHHSGRRAIALVSGGLDSVVSLAGAREELEVRLVLFMNYAQRALARERGAVMAVVDYYGLPMREVDVEWLGSISPQGMCATPENREAGQGDSAPLDTLDAVWIPNRNGVFLNVAAAFAESYGCDVVVTGFNREEAAEFPDNSAEYVTRVDAALELSTRSGVRVRSFTQGLDKRGILRLGVRLGAPLSVVWSCYLAGSRMCGACASCRRLRGALDRLSEDEKPPIEFDA